MKNKWLIGITVPLAALAVWGGMEAKHHFDCQGLEADYLNTVSSLRSNASVRSFLPSEEGKEAADRIEKVEFDRLQNTLGNIYEQCGRRAGETAASKSYQMMF